MTVSLVSHSEVAEVSPAKQKSDPTIWLVTLSATVVSVLSFVYFYHQGTVLAYKDSISHMEIARRVIDSPTAGFGQLGGVWLPLPHLLMLPFVWDNWLYYSGLAGALSGMASYVVASIFVYRIVFDLVGKKLPALAGVLVFMANPNILYMQSTPMTELLLFACMLGMVYFLQRWIQTEEYKYLIYSGMAALLGSLSRYEAWVLFAALLVVMFLAGWRKRYGQPLNMLRGLIWKRYRQENRLGGSFLTFLFIGGLGILGWIAWDGLLLGNPLYFQDGQYAKPSLWVGSADKAVGHLSVALRTYLFAMTDNLHLVIVVLMLVGLLVILVKERLSLKSLPTLALFVLFPFYVYAIYKGQRPLHVTQIEHFKDASDDLYNVRFGLLMILPAAILIGYLTAQFNWRRIGKILIALSCTAVAAVALVVTVKSFRSNGGIITEEESVLYLHQGYTDQSNATSRYLRHNYNGGLVLMQSFGNDLVLFKAQVPLKNNIYEGNYRLWGAALNHPLAHHVRWIIMRLIDQPDEVYQKLHGSSKLLAYRVAYRNSDYVVYERK